MTEDHNAAIARYYGFPGSADHTITYGVGGVTNGK